MSRPKPVTLIILDGWGHREDAPDNAISVAHTPVFDRLLSNYPHSTISTSGAAVGLPAGQMGNSEVGHMNLGAGRVVYQEFTRISRSILTGSFFENATLTTAVDKAIEKNSTVHIMGLLSDGGVHSHEEHIHAVVTLAVKRGASKVAVHAFLDGRDTPPRSAETSITRLEAHMKKVGGGRIASLIGRYYAMDRDHRWERVEEAYKLLTGQEAPFTANSASEGLHMAYERDEDDEFVRATAIVDEEGSTDIVKDDDVILFMNYRSDRAREITLAFIMGDDFSEFERGSRPTLASHVTLTQYKKEYDVPVAYPPEMHSNGFGQYISDLGLRQLRIAETEKYAHVTFFFNGGIEAPYEGEERILIPSPKVATYDMQPQMSAFEVTEKLVEAIDSKRFDAIICNYANTDMVGHTGKMDAAIKAVETIDQCLGDVISALDRVGGELLITADHGNAEQMLNADNGQAYTAHTTNVVPLIYVGRQADGIKSNGALCDIAPTLLQMMQLKQPSEMKGQKLLIMDGEADTE